MRVFAQGTEPLRLPWGTPRPVRFHDAELDLDLQIRARGFVEAEPLADGDSEEWKREIRKAAADALQVQLENGSWTWPDLEKRREALAEAMEETMADGGRRVRVSIADIVPDEPSAKAITEKRALLPGYSLPPAPADSPMIDGPGAWPTEDSGGFGLFKAGETPPAPESRTCPNCGKVEPFYASFCTQCGMNLPR